MLEEDTQLPLEGITVLDMTRYVAGPYCTMLLADAGARVIKVEPIGGELTRSLDPFVDTDDGGTVSAYFLLHNRNKESICLDLKTEAGRRIFGELVAKADVLVENFRPDVLAKNGFDADALADINPRLVYCSISGFGHTESPRRMDPAFAILAEVLAGVLTYNPHPNEPPVWTGLGLGDRFPASMAVSGICMALLRRERTGKGGHVDMSMYDAMISLNERAIALTAMTNEEINIGKPAYTAPFGLFKASDGYICIAATGDQIWERFCACIEHVEFIDDPRLANGKLRADHLPDLLGPAIDNWLSTKTRDEASAALLAHGVPAGPIRNPFEVLADEQTAARDMILHYSSGVGYTATAASSPIRINPLGRTRKEDAPLPGQQTRSILESLGYELGDIEALVETEVVG